jgi:serine/threonine protein kinase
MITPNTILQNRYRVLRELGHGGMGTVYEALDQRVNCIVALKETLAGDNEEARRAFEREASLLGNLRHASLPKVMDYFSEHESDFLLKIAAPKRRTVSRKNKCAPATF